MKMVNLIFLILINFLSLKIWIKETFLQRLSDALEESKNKTITKLPVGSAIIANNYFWLHGRQPFVENKNLLENYLELEVNFLKITKTVI